MNRYRCAWLMWSVCVLLFPVALMAAGLSTDGGQVTVEYLGHACFLITDETGVRIIADPYISRSGRPFPDAVSVDLTVLSRRDADHDAAFQLRGDPVILNSSHPDGTAGEFRVEGFSLRAAKGQESLPQLGFIIRRGSLKIAFLGETDGRLSADAIKRIEGSDAILAGLGPAGPALTALAGLPGLRTLVPVVPEESAAATHPAISKEERIPEISGLERRRVAALKTGANMPREIVILNRKSEAAERAPAGYPVFGASMAAMTWPQIKEAAAEAALVLVPVGVIEEHGPHMGLGADTYLACAHARRIKEALGSLAVKAVVAPPLYWGITDDTNRFPGSFNVRQETMAALIFDMCQSLKDWGFKKILFVNEHGNGNHRRTLKETLARVRGELGTEAYLLDALLTSAPAYDRPRRPGGFEPDYHAGAVETRLMADEYPADVDFRILPRLRPEPGFAPLGYAGDPASYAKETGYAGYYAAAAAYDAQRIMTFLAPPAGGQGDNRQAQADDPGARELVERHLRAVGGGDRLRSIRTQSRAGELTEGERKTPVRTASKSGGGWSLELQHPSGAGERFGFDGSVPWMSERGEVRQLPEAQAMLFTAIMDPHTILRLPRLFTKLSASGTDAQERVLEGVTASGLKWTLGFDSESGLLRRIGDATFEDYREVDGVLVPFTILLREGKLRVSFTKIENNTPVVERDFAPPEAH